MFNWLSSDPTLINCTFSGNSASGDGGAICNEHTSSPTLTNCVFVGNSAEWAGGIANYGSPILINCIFCGNSAVKDGAGIYVNSGKATLSNCILWDNSDRGGSDEPAQISRYSGSLAVNYSCIQGWTGDLGGTGNIDADPCFADPGYWDPNGTPEDTTDDFWVDGGYHLKSQAGRWDANEGGWTTDDVTSSCIDAGDPMSAVGPEPFPNGGIVNMGAYGATGEASKSYFGEPPCEIIVAGDVNGDCLVNFLDFRLMALYWCEDNNP